MPLLIYTYLTISEVTNIKTLRLFPVAKSPLKTSTIWDRIRTIFEQDQDFDISVILKNFQIMQRNKLYKYMKKHVSMIIILYSFGCESETG